MAAVPAHDTLEKAAPADAAHRRADPIVADDLELEALDLASVFQGMDGRQVGAAPPGDDEHHDHLRGITPSTILSLQRSIGNEAVGSFLQRSKCTCSSCAC